MRTLVRSGLLTNLSTYLPENPVENQKGSENVGRLRKKGKLYTFSRYDDALNAGYQGSVLFVVPDEASKQMIHLALEGLVDRDNYGVVALKRKLPNFRLSNNSHKDIVTTEFCDLVKLLGLEVGKRYETCRYDKVVFPGNFGLEGGESKEISRNRWFVT